MIDMNVIVEMVRAIGFIDSVTVVTAVAGVPGENE